MTKKFAIILILLIMLVAVSAVSASNPPPSDDIVDATTGDPIHFDFEEFSTGALLNEYVKDDLKMLITAEATAGSGGQDQAIVFDTELPTPDDEDLGSPNVNCVPAGPGVDFPNNGGPGQPGANCIPLGKTLIIAENLVDNLNNTTIDRTQPLNNNGIGPSDNLVDWPDDNASGGTITLKFVDPADDSIGIPVTINILELLDIEESGPSVSFYSDLDCSNLLATQDANSHGGNSYDIFSPNQSGVLCVFIDLTNASGAFPGIIVTPDSSGKASLGDYVWWDKNSNGIQDDGGSNGINDVAVNLLDCDGGGVASTTTADDPSGIPGYYLFTNLDPNNDSDGPTANDCYVVQFVKPANFFDFTDANQGGTETKDSDANTTPGRDYGKSQQIILAANDLDITIDAGLITEPSSLGDYLWWDKNGNGVQDEKSGDGVNGVTVNLLDCEENPYDNGSGPYTTVTTDDVGGNSGYYEFVALPATQPGGDPADDCYIVEFVAGTLPAGFQFTDPNQGSLDTQDSDVDPVSGRAPSATLGPQEHIETIDAGIKTQGISNYVWYDENADGIQNEGPSFGVNGVTVNLLDCEEGMITSTTTADNPASSEPGYYEFTGLNVTDGSGPDACYIVEFVQPPSDIVDGVTISGFSLQTRSSVSPQINSDPPVIGGNTANIQLSDGEFDSSWDAGLVGVPTAITLSQPLSGQDPATNWLWIVGAASFIFLTLGVLLFRLRKNGLID